MAEVILRSEEELRKQAAGLARHWLPGTLVFLVGPLGVGKTTFVRGVLTSLGVRDVVRSPTFNLIQVFDTEPPVMHADFYRVAAALGTGAEDYLDSHLCLIEWPENAPDLLDGLPHWTVQLEFHPEGRFMQVNAPT